MLQRLHDAKRAVLEIACDRHIAYVTSITVNPASRIRWKFAKAAQSVEPQVTITRDNKRTIH